MFVCPTAYCIQIHAFGDHPIFISDISCNFNISSKKLLLKADLCDDVCTRKFKKQRKGGWIGDEIATEKYIKWEDAVNYKSCRNF